MPGKRLLFRPPVEPISPPPQPRTRAIRSPGLRWRRRVPPPGPKGSFQQPFITIVACRRHVEYRRVGGGFNRDLDGDAYREQDKRGPSEPGRSAMARPGARRQRCRGVVPTPRTQWIAIRIPQVQARRYARTSRLIRCAISRGGASMHRRTKHRSHAVHHRAAKRAATATATAVAALLAAGAVAHAQPAQRLVEPPPAAQMLRSGPAPAALQPFIVAPTPPAPQVPQGEVVLDLAIRYVEGQIYDPATGRDDTVNLRAYQDARADPAAGRGFPLCRPHHRDRPRRDRARHAAQRGSPRRPELPLARATINVPHCLNRTKTCIRTGCGSAHRHSETTC